MPIAFGDDARTMFPGFVGRHYARKGLCLLAINPGGGKDTYHRTREDERFYPLLQQFKMAATVQAESVFESICDEFAAKILPCWRLWNIVGPTLRAYGTSLDEIAFLNAVPYRTREDALPSVPAKTAAWRAVTGPAIQFLEPGMIVALGLKANDVLRRFYHGTYRCVPRTNGDSYISSAARAVLNELKSLQRVPPRT